MTSINNNYTVYASPPPPPPPPPVIGVDGLPKEPEVIVVIGKRIDPYKPLMPYKGLTGAQENARRDQEFACMSPEDRCRALGMDPNASVGIEEGPGLSQDEVDFIEAAYQWSPTLDGAQLIRDEVSEQFSSSIDNKILGEIGERAAKTHIEQKGLQLIGEQVRVIVTDEDGKARIRIYDFLVRDQSGNLQFIEVKANGGTRNSHQVAADNSMMLNGGRLATSKASVAALPRALPPIPVDVWNIILPTTGI